MLKVSLDSQKGYVAVDTFDVATINIAGLIEHLVFLDGVLFVAPSNVDEYAKMMQAIAKYELARGLTSPNFRLVTEG